MKACPAREEALNLLKKYNSEPFHIQHGLTVEGVMRRYANELGYGEDADFWATVGLLHDVDFEKWPEQHCIKAPELLREIGCSDELLHAVCSHGYCGGNGKGSLCRRRTDGSHWGRGPDAAQQVRAGYGGQLPEEEV